MNELRITDYILIGLASWVAFLSFFLIRAVNHYRKLARGQNIQDLGKILERIVSNLDLQTHEIQELSKRFNEHQSIALGHFSKRALIRFNPFEDSGGDQSFVVALMDGKNNGFVLSSLHSRSGTRIYAKEIMAAKPISHKLSKEEKEAVEKAARLV